MVQKKPLGRRAQIILGTQQCTHVEEGPAHAAAKAVAAKAAAAKAAANAANAAKAAANAAKAARLQLMLQKLLLL